MQLGFAGAIAELEREHRSWLDHSAKKKFKNDWQERMALAPLTTCQKKIRTILSQLLAHLKMLVSWTDWLVDGCFVGHTGKLVKMNQTTLLGLIFFSIRIGVRVRAQRAAWCLLGHMQTAKHSAETK